MTAVPQGRALGLSLLGCAALFLLLTLGLAFTIFGEIAALLAVISLVLGTLVLVRERNAR